MRILDRYILKSVLAVFFTCLFVFLLLYIVIDVLAHLEDILKQRLESPVIVNYYLAYLPIILVQISPICCLLATLYTYGRLSHNNEIIALRSAGLSVLQITRTVIVFGIIVSVFMFWINEIFVPNSYYLTQKIKEKMESGRKKMQSKTQQIISNVSMYGLKNRLFFINRFYIADNTMEDIVILEHNSQQDITKKIIANRGVYRNGIWKFYQSITYEFNKEGQIIGSPHYFEEEIMDIPETPAEFLKQRQSTEFMSTEELKEYIQKLSSSGAVGIVRNLKVNLYKRFIDPFTNIIIIILGIPFSLRTVRKATGLASIGMSIILGFSYYILNAISTALGFSGILNPLLSACLSHVLALILGIYLLNTAT
ncbi:MAG: LptF/LptG family permease [Candidatus Omnitrophica bacterium]|nr:LptF/LptG family permease [Candidatus Omnitrophota bacterium]